MKLADYGDGGFDPTVLRFIADRLAEIDATEEASYLDREDEARHGRAVIVTNVGVALFRQLSGVDNGPPRLELAMTPWAKVSMPVITFGGFTTTAPSVGSIHLGFRDPEFRANTTRAEPMQALLAVHNAAVSHWKP